MAQNANEGNLSGHPHVLVIDDDERIRTLVSRYLSEHDFVVITAGDPAEARKIMAAFEFDALIVDVMMPRESGLEFTQSLRTSGAAYAGIPVLLLTALGEAQDRIAGLETGADDYLPKPFEPRELILRLNAIMRRGGGKGGKAAVGSVHIGPWVFDPAYDELQGAGGPVRLTTVEGNLIRALASKPGEVIAREELAALCGLDAGERTIDVQVTRLRRKIEADSKAPRYLQTVRGKGYLLRVDGA